MSESEMVNRVARAIQRRLQSGGEAGWRQMVPAARAAIEAMREPTDDMFIHLGTRMMDTGQSNPNPHEVWDTLFEAALAEPTAPR